MKANLTQTKINQIFKTQEICDELRMKLYDNEDCKAYIRGYEVDKKRLNDILDCIAGSIEELAEFLEF